MKYVGVSWPQLTDDDDPVGTYGDAAPVTIDTEGFRTLDVVVMIGAIDIALDELTLRVSDDDTTYTELSQADYTANAGLTIPGADSDNDIIVIHVPETGTLGRYFQLELNVGNGTAGAYTSVLAILSGADESPNTTAERGVDDFVIVTTA